MSHEGEALFRSPPPAAAPVENHGEPDAAPRRVRSRSVTTSSQRAILVGMLAVAALLGMLSPGAPTGHGVIDAIYRGAFVCVLAMAGSRARRWSVIVASAIAAVASIGLGLLFAGVALLMAVFLVGRDLRNRIHGACIGTFVGLACLRLDVGGALGLSALVAVASAGPMLWSAYRVARRRTRRVVRLVVAASLLVALVGVGLAMYQAVRFVSPLEDGVRATESGVASVQSGKTTDATKQFAAATKQFASVADDSSSWWLFPSRMVPIVAQNVNAVSVMADAGASLTEAAQRTTGKVDYSRIRREGGGVDLEMLAEFRAPVVDAASRLATASRQVRRLTSPWIAKPITDRIAKFDDKVTDLRKQTDLAAAALQYGPEIFGGSGERRYLVLLGNPAEARDIGGHIGNWAELSLVDGKVSLVEVGRPLQLAQPKLDAAIAESGEVPPSFLAMSPGMNPQNWGSSVDFDTDATVAARLYESAVGRHVDGVLYADPFALAKMLDITGPLPIPGLNKQISSANAVKFLTYEQFIDYSDPSTSDEGLTTLVKNLFQKLTESTLPGPAQLGDAFGPLVKQGRFRMVSFHDDDHRLLGLVGLDNRFVPTPGQDLMSVITRNANPSKIDSFLHRSEKYDIKWDPETGSIASTVTVELRNDAPSTGLPAYVIGNSAGLLPGTNISDLAVITPFEATRATVDGVDADVSPLWDGNVWRHTVRVEVPPGQTTTVVVRLEGDLEPGSTYRVRFGGQPLVNEDSSSVRVSASGHALAGGAGIKVSGDSATATLSGLGQNLLTLRADE